MKKKRKEMEGELSSDAEDIKERGGNNGISHGRC